MFSPSRDEARRFFSDTWAKYRRGEQLAGLEQTVLQVVLLHPEYHAILEHPERHVERDYSPAGGDINPFLHLSLHLAVAEQLSIGQPSGIADRYRALTLHTGSEHDALHAILECLGETLWQAQRMRTAPDEAAYLGCIDRRLLV
ncbi:MAG TPA: DUF1841 family protein [Burkholderiales bacterium]|nr:DUF1841 family protein [Burkholderiales bacterium]